jgi:transposase
MITFHVTCPYCEQAEPVIKAGFTDSGTQRARCKDCKKTFAINPKSKAVTPEKEALIESLLEERITMRGIYRAARCGPQTIYAVLKKSRSAPST